MADFPDLERALQDWADECIDILLNDVRERYARQGRPTWERDSDGTFRNRIRSVDQWAPFLIEMSQRRPSWSAVLAVVNDDARLSGQLNALVGTIQGAMRLEPASLFQHCLPSPGEMNARDVAFQRRYSELDQFLAATEIPYCSIWPVPSVTSPALPISLEPDVQLDNMSDREFAFSLSTGIIRPLFPGMDMIMPEQETRTCLRYHYALAKVVGDRSLGNTRSGAPAELESRLQEIKSSFEECAALALPTPALTVGRFNIASDRTWYPMQGVSYGEFTTPRQARFGSVQINDEHTNDLLSIWQAVRTPGLMQRQRGLALALRRLSYRAQRERAEDELLDIMIAAEALYLSDLRNEAYRGELRYRLAQRAALLVDPTVVNLGKREAFELMKSAYDARSAIAHGGVPDPRTIKVGGQKVPLTELLAVTRKVITAGCRTALTTAVSRSAWPPDWDAMAFGP